MSLVGLGREIFKLFAQYLSNSKGFRGPPYKEKLLFRQPDWRLVIGSVRVSICSMVRPRHVGCQ